MALPHYFTAEGGAAWPRSVMRARRAAVPWQRQTALRLEEMMSEEITKVMDEQRDLEIEYAELVQQRDQLKGISNKMKLLETKEGIMVSLVGGNI